MNRLDKEMAAAYALVSRDTFCSETMVSIEKAKAGIEEPRARRLVERRAIFESMARFRLIKVYVGGRETMVPNVDRIA